MSLLLTLLFFSLVIASNSAAPVNVTEIWVEKEYIEEEIWKHPDLVDLATCSKLLDDIEPEHGDPVMDIKNLPKIDGHHSGVAKQKLWPDCLVPVVLEEGMTNTQKKRLACAMRFFFEQTCIRFAKRKEGDDNYVFIQKTDTGCYSEDLGMDGGEQVVNLEEGSSCWSHGTIIHEFMHAIGFFHEQARNDRDDYVEIHWDDIPEGWHSQYRKAAERGIHQRLVGSYDYKSVMHYRRHLTSAPSMTALQSPIDENNEAMGNRKAPTAMDAFKINQLYGCENRDCNVSEWEMQGPCLFGKQIITRRVLQEPVGSGTACPEQLRIIANCNPQVVCPQTIEEPNAATRILLIGGEDDEAGFSMEIYTPNDALGQYMLGDRLTTERKGHVSAVIGDEVITAGGVFSENHHYAVTTEIYNYKLDDLTVGPHLLEARGYSGSVVLDGTFYICGGQQSEDIIASCEKLDNKKKKFHSVPPMSTPRVRFAMATLGGQMYAIGGWIGLAEAGKAIPAEATNTVEKYDPILKQWSPVANMSRARLGHSATALGDHLYVCGPSYCERYSPREDEWSPIASMRDHREGLTMVAFQDRLIVIGGYYDEDGLNVESYLPNENKWEESPDTLIRRAPHCRAHLETLLA